MPRSAAAAAATRRGLGRSDEPRVDVVRLDELRRFDAVAMGHERKSAFLGDGEWCL